MFHKVALAVSPVKIPWVLPCLARALRYKVGLGRQAFRLSLWKTQTNTYCAPELGRSFKFYSVLVHLFEQLTEASSPSIDSYEFSLASNWLHAFWTS
jgi:hypothetical protein